VSGITREAAPISRANYTFNTLATAGPPDTHVEEFTVSRITVEPQ